MSFKRSKSGTERTLSTEEEQMKVLDIHLALFYECEMINLMHCYCTLVQTLIFYLPSQCLL